VADSRLDCARSVTVTVPATSANLGPGFDSLGLAVELRDRVTASVRPAEGSDAAPLVPVRAKVTVRGYGESTLPRDETHLIVRLMLDLWASRGIDTSGLIVSLDADNVIPHARGLGSSAAAIIAGLTLANELLDEDLRYSQQEIFEWGSRLEGHPDNIAPAVFGQFTASWQPAGEDPHESAAHFESYVRPVHAAVRAVVGIPSFEVKTEAVRAALPASVPHAVAAANSGRAALLGLAITQAPEHLLAATRDYLHQDARADAMRPSYDAVMTLRTAGVPAFISGAGPTVMALARTQEETDAAVEEFTRRGFEVLTPDFCLDGVRVER
jgi:homoserine kinase